jgi:hypothetical protein
MIYVHNITSSMFLIISVFNLDIIRDFFKSNTKAHLQYQISCWKIKWCESVSQEEWGDSVYCNISLRSKNRKIVRFVITTLHSTAQHISK